MVTHLPSFIDLDEICNNLEFEVITEVFNDGVGFQKDSVRQE